MKYVLNSDYYFCGWEGLPFAICGSNNPKVEFMNKEQFLLLWSCDGKTDIDKESLKGDIKNFFEYAIAKKRLSTKRRTAQDSNGMIISSIHAVTALMSSCPLLANVIIDVNIVFRVRLMACWVSRQRSRFSKN